AGQERPPSQNNGGQTGGGDWGKFSPGGGRFSLFLPGLPGEKTYDGGGGVKGHPYKLSAGGIEYQVVWFEDGPGGKIQRTRLSALFPLGLNGILTSARQKGREGDGHNPPGGHNARWLQRTGVDDRVGNRSDRRKRFLSRV